MIQIEEYGKKILQSDVNIKTERIFGKFFPDDLFDYSKESDIIEQVKQFNLSIDISKYDYKICVKEQNQGYQMKWHFDDGQIIKHNDTIESNKLKQIKISPKLYLYYPNQIPVYTIIIYFSDANKDFVGGELEFVDGYKLVPEKGSWVFFNSQWLHRVNRVISGKRNCVLIKFYKKF